MNFPYIYGKFFLIIEKVKKNSIYHYENILKFLWKEESNNLNLIKEGKENYLTQTNNILGIILYDKEEEIVINFDYNVIDLITTLKIFMFFEDNIHKTLLKYQDNNKRLVIRKLVKDIVILINEWKLITTSEFIYYIKFLNIIMQSCVDFKENFDNFTDIFDFPNSTNYER